MRLLLAFLVLALGAPTVDAASSTEAAQNVLAADRPATSCTAAPVSRACA